MTDPVRPAGKVLVVDDVAANVELFRSLLTREGYTVVTASDGQQALEMVAREHPDLVLMDVLMPKLSGFEVCERIKRNNATRLTPVVLVTALQDREDRIQGINAGADDFLTKPVNAHELKARARSLVRLKRYTDDLDSAESVILSLALVIEARDAYTEGHCQRLASYATAFGMALGLSDDQQAALFRGGYLHDVGKVGIPDSVLLKTERLTDAEYEQIKQHPIIGDRLCGELRSLRQVRPIVRHHHERLDGTGYPDRLKGDAIPLLAQILSIVDLYDAVTTDRPYKRALSPEWAYEELTGEVERGWRRKDLVDAFIALGREGGLAAGKSQPPSFAAALLETGEWSGYQQSQEELHKRAVELERRVEERTAELAAANQAIAESERRFFDILDRSPAAIFLKDLEGRYLFVNRRCQDVMQKNRRDVVGHSDAELLAPRLAEIYRANDLQVMESGMSLEFEEVGGEGANPRIFHSSKFPLRDSLGKPYALCGISTDITERKHAEDAINTARHEAERANRAKSEFLSRMSHDLRTPLNAVLGFAQLLEMDNLTADQKESVRQIFEAGRHLLGLMNEVLDISRIETGHLSLSPEPVSVADTVEQVVRLLRPLAVARRVEVDAAPSTNGDRHVHADRQRLNQILLNLVSNAIKYNHEGGRVTLSCRDVAGDRVRIVVADTGAGIRPEQLALLFKPFERLGADQAGIEGTGLGLALSRGLIEAMGGSVGVESEVDRGSTFWVELAAEAPVADDAKRAAAPEMAIAAGREICGTVLYIEDNASNVRLLERLLKQCRPGITLMHAGDGEAGIAMARQHKPDLVFLDLHLPDTPGEEVLRQLWADVRTRAIPVAVLSADATISQSRRLLAAGATAYLTKPLDMARLLALLDERFAE